MPNTRAVRSFTNSGMQKANDGGVPAQGVSQNFDSTFPERPKEQETKPERQFAAPVNKEYVEKIPDKIEPFGTPDLKPVSLGGKKS